MPEKPKQDSKQSQDQKPKESDSDFTFRKVDYVWFLLGLVVFGFTAFIFSKVNSVHAVQRNIERYEFIKFSRRDGSRV